MLEVSYELLLLDATWRREVHVQLEELKCSKLRAVETRLL